MFQHTALQFLKSSYRLISAVTDLATRSQFVMSPSSNATTQTGPISETERANPNGSGRRSAELLRTFLCPLLTWTYCEQYHAEVIASTDTPAMLTSHAYAQPCLHSIDPERQLKYTLPTTVTGFILLELKSRVTSAERDVVQITKFYVQRNTLRMLWMCSSTIETDKSVSKIGRIWHAQRRYLWAS